MFKFCWLETFLANSLLKYDFSRKSGPRNVGCVETSFSNWATWSYSEQFIANSPTISPRTMVWNGNNPKNGLISAAWSMVFWPDVDKWSFCVALEAQFVHADSMPFFFVLHPLTTDIQQIYLKIYMYLLKTQVFGLFWSHKLGLNRTYVSTINPCIYVWILWGTTY